MTVTMTISQRIILLSFKRFIHVVKKCKKCDSHSFAPTASQNWHLVHPCDTWDWFGMASLTQWHTYIAILATIAHRYKELVTARLPHTKRQNTTPGVEFVKFVEFNALPVWHLLPADHTSCKPWPQPQRNNAALGCRNVNQARCTGAAQPPCAWPNIPLLIWRHHRFPVVSMCVACQVRDHPGTRNTSHGGATTGHEENSVARNSSVTVEKQSSRHNTFT